MLRGYLLRECPSWTLDEYLIQGSVHVLDRTQPVLPSRPSLPQRQTRDDGTACLFAHLRVFDGTVTRWREVQQHLTSTVLF